MHPLLLLVAVIHFVVFVCAQAFGRATGARRRERQLEDDEEPKGGGMVEGTLFALLGLLVAFTLAGGQDRLDARRNLVVEEADAISTAYLRVDLLPRASQPAIRETFKQYVDARIETYKDIVSNRGVAMAANERGVTLQAQLWRQIVAALEPTPDTRTTLMVVPAINEMLDVTAARDVALHTHLPLSTFVLLELLALLCAFLAGSDLVRAGRRGWPYMFVFASTLAVTAYVLTAIEFPRIDGSQLVHADALFDQIRASM